MLINDHKRLSLKWGRLHAIRQKYNHVSIDILKRNYQNVYRVTSEIYFKVLFAKRVK